jgi:transposase
MCRQIGKLDGVGPITATAMVAAAGDRTCFRIGRTLGPMRGHGPRRTSSGGKARPPGVSSRGDRMTLRHLLEAANAILARVAGAARLRDRARTVARRTGPRTAKVALPHRPAAILPP